MSRFTYLPSVKIRLILGQWLWLWGRAVASFILNPRFESRLQPILFTNNCVEKNEEKEEGNGPMKNRIDSYFLYFASVDSSSHLF